MMMMMMNMMIMMMIKMMMMMMMIMMMMIMMILMMMMMMMLINVMLSAMIPTGRSDDIRLMRMILDENANQRNMMRMIEKKMMTMMSYLCFAEIW